MKLSLRRTLVLHNIVRHCEERSNLLAKHTRNINGGQEIASEASQ